MVDEEWIKKAENTILISTQCEILPNKLTSREIIYDTTAFHLKTRHTDRPFHSYSSCREWVEAPNPVTL